MTKSIERTTAKIRTGIKARAQPDEEQKRKQEQTQTQKYEQ
jgi:hypothetical protein